MTRRALAMVVTCGVGLTLTIAPLMASMRENARYPRQVARTILALYDSKYVERPRSTTTHTLAEMPLNHLGLVVRYHDIRQGLPAAASLPDVRGVITWFTTEGLPNPIGYLRWIDSMVEAGKRVVIIGSLGALRDDLGGLAPEAEVNRTLVRLGWRYDGGWHTTTAGGRYVVSDAATVGFERPLPAVVPPYATMRATSSDARVLLRVEMPARRTASDLAIVTPRGAFVASGYAYFADRSGDREFRQWYLNPFSFFRAAFATDEVPKLDTATLSGRRIYYSHVDGDGWRNLTQIEPFHSQHVIAAHVVRDALIGAAPDLPVTVGAIVGDLDRSWAGTAESLALARSTRCRRWKRQSTPTVIRSTGSTRRRRADRAVAACGQRPFASALRTGHHAWWCDGQAAVVRDATVQSHDRDR